MHDPHICEQRPVELGKASVETRGNAIFDVDLSSGPSRYTPGTTAE